MIDKPKSFYYHDPGRKLDDSGRKSDVSKLGNDEIIGSEISLTLGEVGAGWSTKSKRGTGNKVSSILHYLLCCRFQ